MVERTADAFRGTTDDSPIRMPNKSVSSLKRYKSLYIKALLKLLEQNILVLQFIWKATQTVSQ